MKMTLEKFRGVVRGVVRNLKESPDEWDAHDFSDLANGAWASPFSKKDVPNERGRDGYEDSEEEPRGFAASPTGDFSQPLSRTTTDGNRLRGQGVANFGTYTTAEAIAREVVRNVIREEFGLKPIPAAKMPAMQPFSSRAEVGKKGSVGNATDRSWKSTKPSGKGKGGSAWEDLSRWYDVGDEGSKKNQSMKSGFAESAYRRLASRRLNG